MHRIECERSGNGMLVKLADLSHAVLHFLGLFDFEECAIDAIYFQTTFFGVPFMSSESLSSAIERLCH